MTRKTATIALAAILTTAIAFPTSARFGRCLPDVEQKLAELNIEQSSINKISILPRRQTGRQANTIIGYDATISFKTCRGHLAIDMNRACQVRQVYSRNECRFPGVPAY